MKIELRTSSTKGSALTNCATRLLLHFSRFTPTDNHAPQSRHRHHCELVMEVKVLGVTFDSTLTLHTHINNICRSGLLPLHQIGKIRKFISQELTERIVHAFIFSKLDYCNGLLYGLPSNEIKKLQRLRNSASSLIVRTKNPKISLTPILIKKSLFTGFLYKKVLSSSSSLIYSFSCSGP